MLRPKWETLLKQHFKIGLPVNYLSFDLETTGFSPKEDLPLDFGWCLTRDRQVEDRGSYLLDWTSRPEWVEPAWLQDKIARLSEVYQRKGMCWTYTWDRLRSEGKDPKWVLEFAHSLLETSLQDGNTIVGHNAFPFDRPMLTNAFLEYLAAEWPVPFERMIDTGCLEKSVVSSDILNPEYHIRPEPGETIVAFFQRTFNRRQAGTKWSLDTCFERYNLEEKFGLTVDKLHGAEVDSYAVHLLMELNREA